MCFFAPDTDIIRHLKHSSTRAAVVELHSELSLGGSRLLRIPKFVAAGLASGCGAATFNIASDV
jgi:hypothetical protein